MDNIQGIINPRGKKDLTAKDIYEARERLVNNFGGKIAGEEKSSWTKEEKVASVVYQTLTETLYKITPEIKVPDQIHRLYLRNEVNGALGLLFKYTTKGFWVIFAIVALLALLKFVFS